MERLTLFHNPSCSKSRRAVELLVERGVAFDAVEYLRTPPTRAQLQSLVAMLDGPPSALVRRDPLFAELGLREDDVATAAQVVAVLVANPALMERPVAVRGGRALIARPPERVLELAGA